MKSLWAPGLGRYLLLHPCTRSSSRAPDGDYDAMDGCVTHRSAGARPRLLALSPGDGERKFGRTLSPASMVEAATWALAQPVGRRA